MFVKMAKKILKSLGTLVLSVIGINSYSQDTIKPSNGYKVYNRESQLTEEVSFGDYDKGGKNNDMKIYLGEYNEKRQLTKITINYYYNGNKEPKNTTTYLHKYNRRGERRKTKVFHTKKEK